MSTRSELHSVPVCAAGVGVSGVQGGDPGDGGGGVSPDGAAGHGGPEGERLQTDLHQQTRAALARPKGLQLRSSSLSLKLRDVCQSH